MKWALPYDSNDITKKECLAKLEPVQCRQAEWTRSNHLGILILKILELKFVI